MRKYQEETVTVGKLANVTCNCCGKEIQIDKYYDFLSVDKKWSYESPWDADIHRFDICEKCYSKWISSFEIPIETEETY